MNLATIEELAYLLRQAKEQRLPQPIVFLGAGASKTGGVPLAGEIVKEILIKYKDNPRVKLLNDDCRTYKKLMECLTPYERKELLNEYINNAKVNVTHIYLAQLLIMGYVDYVLTVNFDNLMLRALALFNFFPATYDLSNLKDLTTSSFKEKSVVYLHGQHHGLWLLNTDEEMAKVKEIVPPTLNSIKNQRPWIFIGYSGEDPIFEHIQRLGRFDNGLYWITYQDHNPNNTVCKELLEKANTNAFLIKGFESDSFMLKLTSELIPSQPLIIDKPFTSLKKTLENIVDIDDQEHFKGVKDRLEIVKKDVDMAIQQYEEGKIDSNKNLRSEVEIGILKKQIIDKIIKKDFKKSEVDQLEKIAKSLKSDEINIQLSNLYTSWGVLIGDTAKLKKSADLYKLSFDKFIKAAELNPKNELAFSNWAFCLCELAEITKEEKWYEESFDKYKKVISLNPKKEMVFYNWGTAILQLAKIRNDANLYKESSEKFEEAIKLNSKKDKIFYNWGIALSNLAKLKEDENIFKLAFEKYEKAIELNPKDFSAYNNFGIAIVELAKLKGDESVFKLAFEKYEKAIELNPKLYSAYQNWGSAISELAKLKSDENLYRQSFEKFKKVTELDPKFGLAFYNWGSALFELAKLGNDNDELYKDSLEKLLKAVELGGSSYNLACYYAVKREKTKALLILNESLTKKEITAEYVSNDDDWKTFFDDSEFISLMKKFS